MKPQIKRITVSNPTLYEIYEIIADYDAKGLERSQAPIDIAHGCFSQPDVNYFLGTLDGVSVFIEHG